MAQKVITVFDSGNVSPVQVQISKKAGDTVVWVSQTKGWSVKFKGACPFASTGFALPPNGRSAVARQHRSVQVGEVYVYDVIKKGGSKDPRVEVVG